MTFYKLEYKGKDKAVPLPSDINKFSGEEARYNFAKAQGDGEFDWGNVNLAPVSNITDPLKQIDWSDFREALSKEPSLFNYPWGVFERRIQKGYLSAIVDENNRAIGTVNVVSKLNNGIRSALHLDGQGEKQHQVYETGAGWMAPQYRGKGIYTQLRGALLEEQDAAGRLVFSQSRGKGASNVNLKNDWALVSWQQYPFASALMGWEENIRMQRKFQLAAGIRIDLPRHGLFNDVPDGIREGISKASELDESFSRAHDWEDYHHLWVNKPRKLARLEANIKRELGVEHKDHIPQVVDHALEQWIQQIAYSLFYDRGLLGSTPSVEGAWDEFREDPDAPKSLGGGLAHQQAEGQSQHLG